MSAPAAIPFYKSPQTLGLVTTFVSAALALFPKAAVFLGLTTPTDVENAVATVFAFIALLAPFVGIIVRAKSDVQPITLTQAQADAHPATVLQQTSAPVPPEPPPVPPANASVPVKPMPPVPGKPWGQ